VRAAGWVILGALILTLVGRADLNTSNNSSGAQSPGSSATVIATATTTAVKATAGNLRRIVVTTPIAGTIKLFDLATASCTGTPSTNPKAVITLPTTPGNPFSLEFQQSFSNGICALTSATSNFTVIWD
jgi:hypothetical protein